MIDNKSYTNAPMTRFHKKVFFSLGLGQIACSYALGIAGTALTQASGPLNLNTFWLGLLGSGTLIGLFGSLFIGTLSDRIGRRSLFTYGMILFTILSASQLFVSNLVLLLLIRIGIGLVISIDYTVGAAMLTEWLPEKESPKYQSYQLIFWFFGFIAAYFVGLFANNLGGENWRYLISSSAVLGLIVALWRIKANIPESPCWLECNGKKQEAIKLIHQNLGDEYTLPEVESQSEEKPVAWKDLFSKEVRRNTLVGGIFYACQVFPFFGVGIFLPILLENLNMGNPYLSGILYNIFMMVGVISGIIIFNRISRRAFLLSTFYIAAAALAIMIIWPSAPSTITLIIFSTFSVVLSASTVLQNPYPPELFETRFRGSGVGVVVAMSRIGAASGTFLLPIITESFGVYASLGVCLVFLLIGGVVCQIWAPETSSAFSNKRGYYSNII